MKRSPYNNWTHGKTAFWVSSPIFQHIHKQSQGDFRAWTCIISLRHPLMLIKHFRNTFYGLLVKCDLFSM